MSIFAALILAGLSVCLLWRLWVARIAYVQAELGRQANYLSLPILYQSLVLFRQFERARVYVLIYVGVLTVFAVLMFFFA